MCTENGFPFCRLDGSTPVAKRVPIVEQFNSSHSPECALPALLFETFEGLGSPC